ncbi:MAG TPA: allantoicase [Pseudonocardiaceae bacterium]|nr:allantoicase [Pseudonocardiaceae bacterium]
MSGTDDWAQLPDLADRRVGGSVISANDEFFAERENLIKSADPVFRPYTFTNKGQEYDGWETRRRRRDPGDHDWAIVRLGLPGVPAAVVVDTAFFTGNFPPFAQVEGAGLEGYPEAVDLANAVWEPIVPRSPLAGDTRNVFEVAESRRFTHVRLRIFPDGGVARLRVHGRPVADPRWLADLPFDLAALANGGRVVRCSNWFYSPPNNMLQPGESLFMSDGWESARRRDADHDWAVVRLAAASTPRVVEVDTAHYKGNSPDRVSVSGIDASTAELDDESAWWPVLPETRLSPDTAHRFRVSTDRPVTHVRLDVFPDGGIGRLRVYGPPTAAGRHDLAAGWFGALPAGQALSVLTRDCGVDSRTAAQLVAARPAVPTELLETLETLWASAVH